MSEILHHLDARADSHNQEQRLDFNFIQEQSLGRRGEKGLKGMSVQTQSGTEVVPQMSAKSSACPAT